MRPPDCCLAWRWQRAPAEPSAHSAVLALPWLWVFLLFPGWLGSPSRAAGRDHLPAVISCRWMTAIISGSVVTFLSRVGLKIPEKSSSPLLRSQEAGTSVSLVG